MTARVLVADDVIPNLKLLEARLLAEYFDVVTATSGQQALDIAISGGCDIILLDVMMPGLDGFETCRRLKANPETAHLPVIMVTALDGAADRLRGLDAGADEFLTKPVDEVALIARVRSLARLKQTLDELRARAKAGAPFAPAQPDEPARKLDDGWGGEILVVEDRPNSARKIVDALSARHKVVVETDAHQALFRAAEQPCDLVIASLGLSQFDGLRLCGQLRALDRTRALPLLMLADFEDRDRVLRGLDLGANDYLTRPIDANEIAARVRTQIRRKRYADALRSDVTAAMQLAIVDPLTGLHNRRFLESQLGGVLQQAAGRRRPVSALMLDIDHFKQVNDRHGHDVGDQVLKIFAERVKTKVRGADLLCRLGGEEFILIMPDASLPVAQRVGERIRAAIGEFPFPIDRGAREIVVTVSIGVAEARAHEDADSLLRRADQALYGAKASGRNRVAAAA